MKSMSAPMSLGRYLGVLTAASILLVFFLESVQRGGPVEASAWAKEYPLAAGMNAFLLFVILLVTSSLLGHLGLAVGLALLLLGAFVVVHVTKVAFLGQPLFPWDLLIHREVTVLIPKVVEHLSPTTWVLVGLSLLLFGTLAFVLPKRSPRFRWRVTGVIVGTALALGVFHQVKQVASSLGLQHMMWVQAENTRVNGLLLTFAFNLEVALIQKPPEYDANSVKQALSGLQCDARPLGVKNAESQSPSVIMIMSEAFFDPTQLPGVTFSDDPLPTIRRLQQTSSTGSLYVPVFGGGTANTEYEVLTGHSTRFFPPGSIPYQQYIRRPLPSLAREFSAKGYRTTAIHTYHRWFWDRETVYPHLGFERFIGLEDIPHVLNDGPYVSDSILVREILQEFDAADSPAFIFSVSMEAHGPFEANRYPDSTRSVEGPFDNNAKASLLTYAEAVHHADRELGRLLRELEKRDRPVVVVFFGDHLPALPRVLEQAGLGMGSASDETRAFRYRVPLAVWTNTARTPEPLGELSSSFLGPWLLDYLEFDGPCYFEFVKSVRQKYAVVTPHLTVNHSGQHEKENSKMMKQWWLLQYDQMFGENHQNMQLSNN